MPTIEERLTALEKEVANWRGILEKFDNSSSIKDTESPPAPPELLLKMLVPGKADGF